MGWVLGLTEQLERERNPRRERATEGDTDAPPNTGLTRELNKFGQASEKSRRKRIAGGWMSWAGISVNSESESHWVRDLGEHVILSIEMSVGRWSTNKGYVLALKHFPSGKGQARKRSLKMNNQALESSKLNWLLEQNSMVLTDNRIQSLYNVA